MDLLMKLIKNCISCFARFVCHSNKEMANKRKQTNQLYGLFHSLPLHYFDQHCVDIIDQVEYEVHNRLLIYPLCGIFSSPDIDTR